MLAKHLWISKNNKTELGTCESDVETAWVVQEPDSLVVVRTDTRKHNVVLLASLERIDRGNFNLLVQFLPKRSVGLHGRYNVRALSFVWSNDADMGGLNAGLEEAGDNFLTRGSFSPKNLSG